MANETKTLLHGSAVVLKGSTYAAAALFIRGASGKGKSDLAFRLIEAGGVLLSDDQVAFEKRQNKLYAQTAENIKGLIEVRGIGLLHYPIADPTPLRLVIDLVAADDVPRLPEWETVDILGIPVPRLKFYAFEASAALKVRKAMEIVHNQKMIIK